jgi:outer membrane receptor protein involved in Fe transport
MQAGAQVSFNHRDQIGFSIRGVKNFWDTKIYSYSYYETVTKAINVPDFVIDASIDATILSQLKIRLGYEMQSGRYGLEGYDEIEKMKDIQNVSLGASYIFNKSFSLYLQMNNLLNQKYEYWYTYPEQSITAIAGFTFMF